jgi:hypothetical protein
VPNPNVTVLEWLNGLPAYRGRVAAFGAWDVLPSILNDGRSHLPVGSGFTPVPSPRNDRERAINEPRPICRSIGITGRRTRRSCTRAWRRLRADKPRVLYVMLGEVTSGRTRASYDLYLDAAFRSDRFIQRIWDTVQSLRATETRRRC